MPYSAQGSTVHTGIALVTGITPSAKILQLVQERDTEPEAAD